MQPTLAAVALDVAFVAVLVLVGMLLVYRLLGVRLAAFGRELESMRRELERAERTRAELPRAAEPPAPAPVTVRVPEIDLAPLRADVAGVREELNVLGANLERLAAALERERGARVFEQIEQRFRAAGYSRVRVLADAASIGSGPHKVAVEGTKNGIALKGYVVVDGGRIVEEKMTSSHEVFP